MLHVHLRRAVTVLAVLALTLPALGGVCVVRRAGAGGGGGGDACTSCTTERYSDTNSGAEESASRYNGQKWGFDFTTTQADSLCGITIDINTVGSNSNSSLEFRIDDDSLMESEYTQTETLSGISSVGEWTVTFDPEVSLADATTYYVFISNDSTDWNDRVNYSRLNSDTGVDWWQANGLGATWDELSEVDSRTPYFKVIVCD